MIAELRKEVSIPNGRPRLFSQSTWTCVYTVSVWFQSPTGVPGYLADFVGVAFPLGVLSFNPQRASQAI